MSGKNISVNDILDITGSNIYDFLVSHDDWFRDKRGNRPQLLKGSVYLIAGRAIEVIGF